jgi:hypothetical protein
VQHGHADDGAGHRAATWYWNAPLGRDRYRRGRGGGLGTASDLRLEEGPTGHRILVPVEVPDEGGNQWRHSRPSDLLSERLHFNLNLNLNPNPNLNLNLNETYSRSASISTAFCR